MTTQTGTTQKNGSKTLLWLGLSAVLLLLSGAGIALFIAQVQRAENSTAWFSDPAAERRGSLEYYHKLLQPQQEVKYDFIDPLTVVQITTDTYNLNNTAIPARQLKYDWSQRYLSNSVEPPCKLATLKPGTALDLDGTHIELVAIRSILRLKADEAQTPPANWQWFDLALPPAQREELKQKLTKDLFWNQPGQQERFPLEQLILRFDSAIPPQCLRFNIFDARTKMQLLSSYGTSLSGNYYSFDLRTKMFHAGPAQIMIDMALGEPEIYEFPVERGAGFRNELFDLRLLDWLRSSYSSMSSSNDGRTETIKFPLLETGELTSQYIFFSQPSAAHAPLILDFLDASGSKIRTGGYSSTFCIGAMTIPANELPVSRIRARFRRDVRRIVLDLPYLPGLPEENQNLANLFDVRVPYVRFDHDYEFQDFLRHLLQMDLREQSVPKLPVYPLEFANKTGRELLEAYCASSGASARVDADNHVIYIGPKEDFWQALQSTFTKIMRKLSR